MSTNDVPGSDPANHDELAMGCWAEHEDGSLILVESTEGDRVVYSIFDLAQKPIAEYRDAMPTSDFEVTFSWRKGAKEKWTWHDKTPFPWNRVIKQGARDGQRYASAADQLTAAQRVAESMRLRAQRFDPVRHGHLQERTSKRGRAVVDTIQQALDQNERENARLKKALAIANGDDDDTGEFEAVDVGEAE